MQFDQSTRREFITLLGGVAAWPFVARAQQGRMPDPKDTAEIFAEPFRRYMKAIPFENPASSPHTPDFYASKRRLK